MDAGTSSDLVVAEMIGKRTYRPLINLRRGEHQPGEIPIVKAVSLYRKSLQIIPSGPYTLRFVADGVAQEYPVRVANKTVVRVHDKERQAA